MAKKKGGGKKGGGKKGGASGADKLTPHEALLAHQVNIHQQNNIQISDEIDQLKVEREKLSVTQKMMNNEVNNNVGELLKRDKNFEENAADRKQDSHNEVRTQRQGQIQLNKDLDGDVDTCLQEISQVEINSLKMKHEIVSREKFYKNEYVELTDKVKLLEKRLSEMVNQFDEMKANLNSQVENSRLQEEDRTQTNLEKQRLRAIEYAIERLPPQQAQELRENRWLLSEASVHRDQIKVLYGQVEKLERRNLELMNIVYTKRMDRLGMLMKSAKMGLPTDETIDKLTMSLNMNTNDMNSADQGFSLSEIDLNATNFKAIQDPNADPSKVADFEFRLKHTQSTDLMNKVAGLMVQGKHKDVEEKMKKLSDDVMEVDEEENEEGQWPVTIGQLRSEVKSD